MDNKEVTCLVMLGLSATFNMASHSLLLNRLQYHFGIQGSPLSWIKSYLEDHTQQGLIDDPDGSLVRSNNMTLAHGVPQGHVLGLIMFNLYTSPLGDIARNHWVIFHAYANDKHTHLSSKPAIQGAKVECLNILQNCIADI